MKAMAKEPRRRYATAADLSADLHRYLEVKPILARPIGHAERFWRWCRRSPVTASLSGMIGVLGLTLVLCLVYLWGFNPGIKNRPFSKIVVSSPSPSQRLIEGKDKPEVLLEAKFTPPFDSHNISIRILRNGQIVREAPKSDKIIQQLSETVPLVPGGNRLQVKLISDEQEVVSSDELEVQYFRPPKNIRFEVTEANERPFINLIALVDSLLPLESVTVKVNDRPLKLETIQVDRKNIPNGPQVFWNRDKGHTWLLRILAVPLETGINRIVLQVSNSEGESLQPGSCEISFDGKRSPNAYIEILDGSSSIVSSNPNYDLNFLIYSSSPLQRLQVLNNNEVASFQSNVSVQKTRDEPVKQSVRVKLKPGPNRVEVVTVNAAGEQRKGLTIYYVAEPVEITISKLEVMGHEKQVLVPIKGENNQITFNKPISSGKAWLYGTVSGPEQVLKTLNKQTWIRTWVNGYELLVRDTHLQPNGSNNRNFRIEIHFDRAVGNFVEIEFPGLKEQKSYSKSIKVDCLEPVRVARLHVLAIGLGMQESKLKDRVLRSIDASSNMKGGYQSPVYSDVRLYGPLAGYVSPEQIYTQLCLIKKTIDLKALSGSLDDSVLIYVEGNEKVTPEGRFIITSATKYDPNLHASAVSLYGILAYVAETQANQVLLRQIPP
jgi:hypothetical protein